MVRLQLKTSLIFYPPSTTSVIAEKDLLRPFLARSRYSLLQWLILGEILPVGLFCCRYSLDAYAVYLQHLSLIFVVLGFRQQPSLTSLLLAFLSWFSLVLEDSQVLAVCISNAARSRSFLIFSSKHFRSSSIPWVYSPRVSTASQKPCNSPTFYALSFPALLWLPPQVVFRILRPKVANSAAQ